MPRMDRRRRYDFKKFREELERLDSEDIRERLNRNRIRSTQRRALAEEVLRERAQAAQAAKDEAAPTAARRTRATRASEMEAAAAAEPGGGATERPGEAAESAYDARRRSAGREQTASRRADLPTARQLGCVLCMLTVLGGMAVIMAGLLRR